MFAVFGIGNEVEEGHTNVSEEQKRDGWNEEEENLERRMRTSLEERLYI